MTAAGAPEGAVSRSPVIDRARGSSSAVVTVVAPAGSGKTSLLAEWAAIDGRAVGRLPLSEAHDDPLVLLSDLARSCSAFSSDAVRVADLASQPGTGALSRTAPLVAAMIAQSEAPFVLLVDDVHLLRTDASRDALEIACSRIPAGSQLVLAGRESMAGFARMRMHGRAFEVPAEALAIDVDGAKRIARGVGVRVLTRTAAEWVRRCEGWAAGVHMCAVLHARGEPLSLGRAADRAETERLHAEQLYAECLETLSDDVRDFVLSCSVLEDLNADLCAAVTGRSDAHRILEEVRGRQLFLVSDRRGEPGSYRFHDLFREFLRSELRGIRAHDVPELRRRAARWQERHGWSSDAIEHYLAIGDAEDAARLIERKALPAYQAGRAETVARWISQLGDAVLLARPLVAILGCWLPILMGDPELAEHRTALLDRIPVPERDGAEGWSFEAGRSMVRSAGCVRDLEELYADAVRAVEAEPFGSQWRDRALQILGALAACTRRPEAARRALQDAVSLAEAFGNHDSVLLACADLAALAIREGSWDDAATWSARAVETIRAADMEGYAMTAFPYAVHARVLLRQGRSAAAEGALARAMAARTGLTRAIPLVAVPARAHLALAQLGRGDAATARMLLQEIDDILRHRPHIGAVLDDVAQIREQVGEAEDNIVAGSLTIAELRVLPYLQTHLKRSEIGERLGVSRHTVGSQISAVFRKLGVSNRADAVDRATRMGLLGEPSG